ncbi:hypothetical protein [Psychroserpens luteolus]|uniref:hypothetical protein n=1 Tax=Psychroserpens luteolus TaxID=2855840 RepID=UPI001E5548CB|nr:hypothetical protein [Psychroserpens luteolus]MCD2258626.1 hypothetical protein [Psychroserpens luteolus]
MGEIIENHEGLFVGLSSIPIYSNEKFDISNFSNNIIDKTFAQFREELKNNLKDKDQLDDELYKSINFYAFGFFNLITFSFIDDFHFGNFSFRPYNKHIGEGVNNSNFQFQVVNGYNLRYNNENLTTQLEESPFICVCKLKINSSLLIGIGRQVIEEIINELKATYCDQNCRLIISESFSWHEITVILMSDNLTSIMERVKKMRFQTTDTFQWDVDLKNSLASFLTNENTEGINIFTDTESIFGINPKFFGNQLGKKTAFFKNYEKLKIDDEIKISTKIQMKTGHASQIQKEFFENESVKALIEEGLNITSGRSDYTFRYKQNSIINYINFWDLVINDKSIKNVINSNVRKLHSNISMKFNGSVDCKLNTDMHANLFKKLKFSGVEIGVIESQLKKLKVSKEISNSVLTLYTNFNDIICDVNLYCFYIDLKSLLDSLKGIIYRLSNYSSNHDQMFSGNSIFQYRKVTEISKMLLLYIRNFQTAYGNRFLDSKRNGYNLDTKGEFNGGVHQVIHAYDSLFKIASESLRLANISNSKDYLPIASFGDYENGIKASINNLHLNYFQLFQPEFFLFSMIKESINALLDFSWLEKTDDGIQAEELLALGKLKRELAISINSEPSLKNKELLFEYLPPEKIDRKINYFLYYSTFIELIWKDDIETFTFWLWNVYIQTSNLYNIDGTIRIDLFKEHFAAYYISVRHLYLNQDNINQVITTLIKDTITSPDLLFYIFDKTDGEDSVFEECDKLYNYILKNDNEYKILQILTVYKNHANKMKLGDLSDNDFFNKVSKLITTNIVLFKDMIESSGDGGITSYVRKPASGHGIYKDNYSDAVFDPHGGLFVREPNLRKKFLSLRMNIINEARDISYKYKIAFYKKEIEKNKKEGK